MATQPFASSFRENSDLARSDERSGGFQKGAPAVLQQINAILIQIGPGDLFAATHADFISAVSAAATVTPVHKKVVKAGVRIQIGRLDGIIMRQGIYRGIRRQPFAAHGIESD